MLMHESTVIDRAQRVILIFIFSQEDLRGIASYLNLVPPVEREKEENWYRLDIDFLRELLVGIKAETSKRYRKVSLINVDVDAEDGNLNFRFRDTSVDRRSSRN